MDVNEQKIAVSETDRVENMLPSRTFPACVKNLSTDQTRALYGDICKKIVELAIRADKPTPHENLEFGKKKASLREQGVSSARILSGFAYSTFLALLGRRAAKQGVIVRTVNPAFTSVIGKVNYMNRYSITPHEAAALVIARRAQRLSEKPDSASIAPPVP